MTPWMASARTRIFACLVILFSATTASAETIRVRLQRLSGPISLGGIALRYPGSPTHGALDFRALKIHWRQQGSQIVWTLRDRDTGAKLSSFRARTLELAGLSLRMNLKSVPDRLSFVPVSGVSRSIDLVAKMDLEEYLKGVVPSEMPKGWPIEALKAQAVAARTYALYRKNQRADAAYDLESDVTDQVFLNPLGLPMDKGPSNVELAIRETRGIVLLDPAGQPVPTYFHADCGGRTEEARDVWGSGEVQGTAVDKGCPLNPIARWAASFSAEELATKFRKTKLVDLRFLDRTGSGRVGHIRLTFSDGTATSLTGNDFRMAVGHERLRSTQFDFHRSGEVFEFRGVGFGHGAGLCQWGAKRLATGGAFYTEILLHYYPKALIQEPIEAVAASTLTSTKRL